MRKLAALLLAAMVPATACAQPAAQPLRAGAPKLIVVLSIDQLSADLFDEYRL